MKSKPSIFFTRPHANKGAKMFLKDPVTGQPTEDFLHVLGLESDAFKEALTAKHKENARILALPEAEQADALAEAELQLFASLVTGWSFDNFSVDGVKELLREAPQVKKDVDTFAGDRANFITRPSKN